MLRKHFRLFLGLALSLATLTPATAGPVTGGGGSDFRPSFFDVFVADDCLMNQTIEGLREDGLESLAEDGEEIVVFILLNANDAEADMPTEMLSLNFTSTKQVRQLNEHFGATINASELPALGTMVYDWLKATAAGHGASEETLALLGEVQGFFAYGTLKYG